MAKRTRRIFTETFKTEALRLAQGSDGNIAAVARNLDADRSPHFSIRIQRMRSKQKVRSERPEYLTAPRLLGEHLSEANQQLDAALLGPGS